MSKPSARERARVFWSGNSQAVRLPKRFRLDVDEVVIHREGDRLVLEPAHRRWSKAFRDAHGAAPDLERPEQLPHERREDLFS